MKKFISVEIEVVNFDCEDVIRTSGSGVFTAITGDQGGDTTGMWGDGADSF